jgi:hypothetical protein
MAKKTPEEIRKEKRAEARKRRRLNKAKEAAFQAGVEEAGIDPEALGVSQQAKAGTVPPKKITEARQNLSDAFDLMGGVPALVAWGKKNPTEFYRIWARLIPKEAVAASTALPLEDLLTKLANRAEQSVADAAAGIGAELLQIGKDGAELEDRLGQLGTETIQ